MKTADYWNKNKCYNQQYQMLCINAYLFCILCHIDRSLPLHNYVLNKPNWRVAQSRTQHHYICTIYTCIYMLWKEDETKIIYIIKYKIFLGYNDSLYILLHSCTIFSYIYILYCIYSVSKGTASSRWIPLPASLNRINQTLHEP